MRVNARESPRSSVPGEDETLGMDEIRNLAGHGVGVLLDGELEKMASSVGSSIRERRRSMESSATSLPRWRMTTWEQTRSTVSSSCELKRTTLPRAAAPE